MDVPIPEEFERIACEIMHEHGVIDESGHLHIAIASALMAERERCAKVVEARCIGFSDQDAELNEIAAAIRRETA